MTVQSTHSTTGSSVEMVQAQQPNVVMAPQDPLPVALMAQHCQVPSLPNFSGE